MAAMASKFNFECVIQNYTDQWSRFENLVSSWALMYIHLYLFNIAIKIYHCASFVVPVLSNIIV